MSRRMDRAWKSGANDVRLWTQLPDTREWVSHFRLSEFARADGPAEGFALVNKHQLLALEWTWRDLAGACIRHGLIETSECFRIRVTGPARTAADNAALAATLGWAGEGGSVSRDTTHLAEYRGMGTDIVPEILIGDAWGEVPQNIRGPVLRHIWDFVIDNYADGHAHVDLRDHAAGVSSSQFRTYRSEVCR